MPDPDFSFLAAALSQGLFFLQPLPAGVLAYLGPGPALDFIPYFLALLAWLGAAFGAMLLWPLSALLRRLRSKPRSGVEEQNELLAAEAPEAAGDDHHDGP